MNGKHGLSRYKTGCKCAVCAGAGREASRAWRLRVAAQLAAEHSVSGVEPRCRCAFCTAARRGVAFEPDSAVVSAIASWTARQPIAVRGRDVRAVVCCEVEAFEAEGAGHDPYCPTRIGGAA